jgi:hypothetical protein
MDTAADEDAEVVSQHSQMPRRAPAKTPKPKARLFPRPSDATTSAGSLFDAGAPDSPSIDPSQAVDAQDDPSQAVDAQDDPSQAVDAQDAPMEVDQPTQPEDPDPTNGEFLPLITPLQVFHAHPWPSIFFLLSRIHSISRSQLATRCASHSIVIAFC